MGMQQIDTLKKQNAMLTELNQRLSDENRALKKELHLLEAKCALIEDSGKSSAEELNRIYQSGLWRLIKFAVKIKNGIKRRLCKVLERIKK